MTKRETLVLILIMIAMLSRFIFLVDGVSVLPNFTAVGAIAIFGAVYFKGMKKWIMPLGVLWLSDIILNNLIYAQYYDHFQIFGEIWVYMAIACVGFLAYTMMKNPNWIKLLGTCLAGAVLFFAITNFGVWLNSASPYSKDLNGLLQCYQAGIPFFRNTLLSNLFYGFALFGIYESLAKRITGLYPLLSAKPIAE